MVSDELVLWPPKYLCMSIHVSPFLRVENIPSSRGTINCLIQLLIPLKTGYPWVIHNLFYVIHWEVQESGEFKKYSHFVFLPVQSPSPYIPT